MAGFRDVLAGVTFATAATRDISLVFLVARTRLDSIELDATLSEDHGREAEITEHPVEQGVAVTDHVRPKPITLKLEGIISDDPVHPAGRVQGMTSIDVRALAGGMGRTADAFEQLEALFAAATPITVVTRLKTYDNMVLQSLGFPVDRETGAALRVSAVLKEIRIVSSETVPALEVRRPVDRGRQVAAPAAPAVEQKASVLHQVFDGFGWLPRR